MPQRDRQLLNDRYLESKLREQNVRVQQNSEIAKFELGDVFADAVQKGNYGEMKTDQVMSQHGYTRISNDIVTGLMDAGHQGIDGVYYKPDGIPPFVIAEAKYNTSRLGKTQNGRQMSVEWIENNKRLLNAVGMDMSKIVNQAGYARIVIRVKPDGSVTTSELK